MGSTLLTASRVSLGSETVHQVLTAKHSRALGWAFNVTDSVVRTMREIVSAMRGAIGRHPPRLRFPTGTVRAAVWLAVRGYRLARRTAPIGPGAISKLLEDLAVSGARIMRELGFVPKFDLETGWRATVAELSDAHAATTRPESQ